MRELGVNVFKVAFIELERAEAFLINQIAKVAPTSHVQSHVYR